MIMKAAVGKWGFSAPVNDTPETLSLPSFRKSNLWPLRSSWICISDQGIPLPNTLEKADGYAGVRTVSPLCESQTYCIFRQAGIQTRTYSHETKNKWHYNSFCAAWHRNIFHYFDLNVLVFTFPMCNYTPRSQREITHFKYLNILWLHGYFQTK